jgi:DNA-binding response OmpR family regulator
MIKPSENPFPNALVLIIEDDEEMRSLLKDFFVEEGFETDSVSNGYDALGVVHFQELRGLIHEVILAKEKRVGG